MRLRWGLLSLLAAAACSTPPDDGGDEAHVLDDQPILTDDGKGDGASLPGTTVELVLENGAVPGSADRPNAVVYIPHGYDTSQPNVVVYLHGWYNCARNVIRSRNGVCAPGHAVRNAYNLAGQLETSNKNAILVVPELMFDQPSSNPGALGQPDVFYALLDEVMTQLGDQVGGMSVWDVSQVVVASHSGGDVTAASIVSQGGWYENELWLLDSLYEHMSDFDAWVTSDDNKPSFAAQPFAMRFANVYTGGGGTLANSQEMAKRAGGWFDDASVVLDDRSGRTLVDADYAHGLVFKRSGLAHDDVPRYYFGRLLATSGLPAKP
jgi:hypothetical protein